MNRTSSPIRRLGGAAALALALAAGSVADRHPVRVPPRGGTGIGYARLAFVTQ